jgi:beta-glucanase (GH16 family)
MVHRIDWTPDKVVWYTDGDETATIAFQTPTDPSRIIFNAWGDGGSWSGNMSVYDEAYLQIQWIEMVYNQTGDTGDEKKRRDDDESGDSCTYVCSIDEADEAGAITVLWNSSAAKLGKHHDSTWYSWRTVLGTSVAGGLTHVLFYWLLL